MEVEPILNGASKMDICCFWVCILLEDFALSVKLPALKGGVSRKGKYLFQIASPNPALKGGACREANRSKRLLQYIKDLFGNISCIGIEFENFDFIASCFQNPSSVIWLVVSPYCQQDFFAAFCVEGGNKFRYQRAISIGD
jgi:hypothetical protein